MLEIITTFLTLVPLGLIAVFFLFAEYLDWDGRMEVIEQKHPKLWRVINDRSFRLVVLFFVFAIVATDLKEDLKRVDTEPPVMRFVAPKPPVVEELKPESQESPFSLRKRTIKLADELRDFLGDRIRNHPPYAYPDSSNPNPSDERKAAIKKCVAYDQETMELYVKRYRDRLIGIIREYDSKGVNTNWLESSAKQRPLQIAGEGWEGSPMDELTAFRNLAYHVDASDNLIVIQ